MHAAYSKQLSHALQHPAPASNRHGLNKGKYGCCLQHTAIKPSPALGELMLLHSMNPCYLLCDTKTFQVLRVHHLTLKCTSHFAHFIKWVLTRSACMQPEKNEEDTVAPTHPHLRVPVLQLCIEPLSAYS
eukprot:1152209-Pelagomonas_calceolata.AAC.6